MRPTGLFGSKDWRQNIALAENDAFKPVRHDPRPSRAYFLYVLIQYKTNNDVLLRIVGKHRLIATTKTAARDPYNLIILSPDVPAETLIGGLDGEHPATGVV